jgi:hypothetical protein
MSARRRPLAFLRFAATMNEVRIARNGAGTACLLVPLFTAALLEQMQVLT